MAGKIVVMGAPVDCLGVPGGCELSPTVLREHGLAEAVGATADLNDLPVRIYGSRDAETGIRGFASAERMTRIVRQQVGAVVGAGDIPLVVGGCCAPVIGAVAGARDWLGRVGLAYVDGHLDLYDGRTSPTGEMADMPLGILLGYGPAQLHGAMGAPALVDIADVHLLGYRDAADAATKGSRLPSDLGSAFNHVDAARLGEIGPARVGERASMDLIANAGKYWLHIDWDVLDETQFPAIDYRMPEGLTWRALVDLLHPLVNCDGLIGVSFACYNPEKDEGYACAQGIVQSLRRVFQPRLH